MTKFDKFLQVAAGLIALGSFSYCIVIIYAINVLL